MAKTGFLFGVGQRPGKTDARQELDSGAGGEGVRSAALEIDVFDTGGSAEAVDECRSVWST